MTAIPSTVSDRTLTVESDVDGETIVTINKTNPESGVLPYTMAQVRVQTQHLVGALALTPDAALVERLKKLAGSWDFTNKEQAQQLRAALNPFEPEYHPGDIIRGKRAAYADHWTLFLWHGRDHWIRLGTGEMWSTTRLLAECTEIEYVHRGLSSEAIDSYREVEES
ncbi:hypothetical protein SEA_RIZWANA_94 [Arthrobacter phage Rizwana]|nr:hypothetical protein SEA_RIZWANA_94 [Arthrobacter phage Rizwana]